MTIHEASMVRENIEAIDYEELKTLGIELATSLDDGLVTISDTITELDSSTQKDLDPQRVVSHNEIRDLLVFLGYKNIPAGCCEGIAWMGMLAGLAAVICNCIEAVSLLLAHPRINLSLETAYGFTALGLASDSGNEEICSLLLKHYPDKDQSEDNKRKCF